MPRWHPDRLARLVARWIPKGAVQLGPQRWGITIAGDCLEPAVQVLWSRPDGDRWAPGAPTFPLTVEMRMRCSRCRACLARRAAEWTARAVTEACKAPRTWLGTLTFAPMRHHHFLSTARAACAAGGEDYDALNERDRWKALVTAESTAVTLFLKRLRREATDAGRRIVPVRYLLVAEAHNSGWPHFHMLVHEVDAAVPVRKARMEALWEEGHSAWRLLRSVRGATYPCKYLSKSMLARVRASMRYGKRPQTQTKVVISPPCTQNVTEGNDTPKPTA